MDRVQFGMWRTLAAVCALWCSTVAFAVAQTPISCGQALSGSLSPGEIDTYLFDGNVGEAVSVAGVGVTGSLRIRVEVYTPTGVFLGRDTDFTLGNGGEGNQRIQPRYQR